MEPLSLRNTFVFKTSSGLSEKLIDSLENFIQIYDQRKDDLQRASKHFTQASARVNKKWEGCDDRVVQGLFSVCGGALGVTIGGVTGGIWGALGAVSAATYAKLCGDVNAVGATVGFVGSIFGGVVGGAFAGLTGGSVYVGALAAGREVHGVVSDILWFIVGFVTGGAIGSTFGGSVGAAGGAVGGGFGALHGTSAAIYLVGSAIACYSEKDPKGTGKQTKKAEMMQKTGGDFSESIKPLVDELKTIQEICDKMASSDAVKGVADQTAKTLAAVNKMEKSVSDSQTAADVSEFLCCVKEALSRCKNIPEELQRMREEVEKLLISLKKR